MWVKGSKIPTGRGNVWICLAHFKALESLLWCYAAKGIFESSVMACSEGYDSVVNNVMTRYGLSSKFSDHFLLLLMMYLLNIYFHCLRI